MSWTRLSNEKIHIPFNYHEKKMGFSISLHFQFDKSWLLIYSPLTKDGQLNKCLPADL